ncbi:MAG: DUF4349 domain-containing protein [Fimbriimonas sp.]|nr:DUF4349 domain-containing protein [Fimbriimonas sp.]
MSTIKSFAALANVAIALALFIALAGCAKSDESSSVASATADKPNVVLSSSESQKEAPASAPADSAASPAVEVRSMEKAPMMPRPMGGMHSATWTDTNGSAIQASVESSRNVIRNADLDVRVPNVEKAEKQVSSIVRDAGGYTESATSSDLASGHPSMTISLRIPVGLFDESIAKFEGLGVRLSKTINSQDVTGHIVDLDAQLKMLSIQEEVYRNMLKGRTRLNEVFEIQQQLTSTQTQIEDIAGQRKSQAGLAALSTIKLTLEQDAVISQVPTDPNWLVQSWAGATSSAGTALRGFAVALMWIVAFCPFWIPVLIVLRKAWRDSTRSKDSIGAHS